MPKTVSPDREGTETHWMVYILECSDGSLYTGVTNHLTRRLKEHNEGTGSRYTRSRLPVKIVYHEACTSRSHALKREHSVRILPRKIKQALINTLE